jgi:uncharacterized protein YndB with AHSA1/START domain
MTAGWRHRQGGTHRHVARNSIQTRAQPAGVFSVLDDACAYPRWVVGARRVRAVDPTWPAVGSSFHHAIGAAGVELHDSSQVLERDPPRRLVLEVRFRPTGVARVEIQVDPAPAGSTIIMTETPTRGPASRLPRCIVDAMLTIRNTISLQRLRREAERSAEGPRATGQGKRPSPR